MQKIAKLRAELEASAPPPGDNDEWTSASELAEVEALAEMGVIVNSSAEASSSKKGKGRSKNVPAGGHVVFVDDKEDCKSAPRRQKTHTDGLVDSYGADAGPTTAVEAEEEAVDLGWLTPEPKRKRGAKKAPAPAVAAETVSEEDARAFRMEQLGTLSALLGRVRALRTAEARLEGTKNRMGKGAARKIKEAGWVEDESVKEDRNGDRKRWEGKQWKWKLERRK